MLENIRVAEFDGSRRVVQEVTFVKIMSVGSAQGRRFDLDQLGACQMDFAFEKLAGVRRELKTRLNLGLGEVGGQQREAFAEARPVVAGARIFGVLEGDVHRAEDVGRRLRSSAR